MAARFSITFNVGTEYSVFIDSWSWIGGCLIFGGRFLDLRGSYD